MTEIICITDKNHPALPAIIEWLYDWWGKDEDYTKEQVEAYVRNAVCKDRIPQVFLILLPAPSNLPCLILTPAPTVIHGCGISG